MPVIPQLTSIPHFTSYSLSKTSFKAHQAEGAARVQPWGRIQKITDYAKLS